METLIESQELESAELRDYCTDEKVVPTDPLNVNIHTKTEEFNALDKSVDKLRRSQRCIPKLIKDLSSTSDSDLDETHKKRWKKDVEAQKSSTELGDEMPSRLKAWRQRKRNMETLEEAETRRMRARINNIKTRLIARLKLPESELEARRKRDVQQNSLRRKKRWANQTPEEVASRRALYAQQKRWVRNRKEATETAEETANRKKEEREKYRHYRANRYAQETDEERTARKEKERIYRERIKQRKLEKKSFEHHVSGTNTAEISKLSP